MPAPRKNPSERRERAVRLVLEAREQEPEPSLNAAAVRIGDRVGIRLRREMPRSTTQPHHPVITRRHALMQNTRRGNALHAAGIAIATPASPSSGRAGGRIGAPIRVPGDSLRHLGRHLRHRTGHRRRRAVRGERGEIDHVSVCRLVLRFTPVRVDAAGPCRRAVGIRWVRRQVLREARRAVTLCVSIVGSPATRAQRWPPSDRCRLTVGSFRRGASYLPFASRARPRSSKRRAPLIPVVCPRGSRA